MSKTYRSLGRAAEAGDLDAVKEMLASGKAKIDARGGGLGRTPLSEAIANDHLAVALYLVKQKADPNAADRGGWTPLLWAASRSAFVRHRNVKLAAALLDAGADVDARDEDGMTPLMWAANRGADRLVKLLLDRGADVNAKTTQKYNSKRTALMFAQGLAMVWTLLEAGADPKAVEESGMHTWDFHRGPARKLLKERAGVK
jgi:ankyrin repeat protein